MAQVNVELLQKTMFEYKNLALEWQAKQDAARARLKAVGWRRFVFFWRYKTLREEISKCGWERFGYTAMMMDCARTLKRVRKSA